MGRHRRHRLRGALTTGKPLRGRQGRGLQPGDRLRLLRPRLRGSAHRPEGRRREGPGPSPSPEDYVPDLAGKSVVFKVKVKEVKEPQAPEVDDEFAKDVSEFETLADFKKDLGEKLQQRRTAEAQNDFESAVLDQAHRQPGGRHPRRHGGDPAGQDHGRVRHAHVRPGHVHGRLPEAMMGMTPRDAAHLRQALRPAPGEDPAGSGGRGRRREHGGHRGGVRGPRSASWPSSTSSPPSR